MKPGKQIQSVTELPVAEIEASERMRPVSEAGVTALLASIETLGVMMDPVQVRRVRHQDNRLVLMAGAHRLEAAQRLGWEMIPAAMWECSDAWAELMEIDDNLAGADLTPLDQAVFLARRKQVYEQEFPEARQGGNRGNQHTGGRQTDIESFCQATAEKFGKSERHIRRMVAAGEALTEPDVAVLRAAPRPVRLADLQTLAKVTKPAARSKAVACFGKGDAKSIAEALKQARGAQKPLSKTDAIYTRLMTAWAGAPMAARRMFVEELGDDLRALLDGGDPS